MDGFISRIVDNNMYAAIQEIATLHCVPLAMTYEGVIASRLLSVIARRRSRRSNLLSTICHCEKAEPTKQSPIHHLSLREGGADEAISKIAVLNSR